MKKYSSIHNLNSDIGLGMISKLLWIILNYINNKLPLTKVKRFDVLKFSPNMVESDWSSIDKKMSPSRALSDLFLSKIEWTKIKSEIGAIHIFDTGAGDGKYGEKINTFSGGISSYLGIDHKERGNWKQLMTNNSYISMKKIRSDDILSTIPDNVNFIMTHSAIEHFDNDLSYFYQIKRYIDLVDRSVIQVHLFPSAACLTLLGMHGIRQYTERTVNSIAEIFDSQKTYSILFNLGGNNSNKAHRNFITIPRHSLKREDYRDTMTDVYWDVLMESLQADFKSDDTNPNYYALVIHSNYTNKIFYTMKSLQC